MSLKKVRRIYHPYWDWECFHAGMFANSQLDADFAKGMYRDFLANIDTFNYFMSQVVEQWPKSCEHFLTNPDTNRVAWLGQSSMCMATGVSRKYRSGFMLLADKQQQAANHAASQVLMKWIESRNT